MASLNQSKSGKWRVQFSAKESVTGKRCELVIAQAGVSEEVANKIYSHIMTLRTARVANVPLDETTAVWLNGLDRKFRGRLVDLGIAPPDTRKQAPTLAELRKDYFATKKNFENTTRDNCRYAYNSFEDFFGSDRVLDTIGRIDAEQYLNHLKTQINKTGKPNSGATVERRFRRASEFTNFAIKQGVEMENPFNGFKLPSPANPANRQYISAEDIEKMIAVCENPYWKLLLAVARYMGLRMNSEIRFMRWKDIDWENQLFTIHDKKNKRDRVMPICPELMAHLKTHYDGQDGEEFIFPEKPFRLEKANLRTQFDRYAKEAGVGPFKRAFQNMRSSRETELEDMGLPDRIVCEWMGNSPGVKNKFYGQTLKSQYDKVRSSAPGICPEKSGEIHPIDESIRKMFAGEITPAESLAVYMNDPEIQAAMFEMLTSEQFVNMNMQATQMAMKKAASQMGLPLTPRIGLEPIT